MSTSGQPVPFVRRFDVRGIPSLEDLDQPIPGIVGRSGALRQVVRSVRKLARTNAAVLLQGETGTGKELVARAIHHLGPRADGPFVVVDCGALSPTLIASQLFGHERGAFTGAEGRREGAFEMARGGVLFLDEIGDLPLEMQPALLGALERKAFRRLGGKEDVHVDVRVVSATNRDLDAEVGAGTFRADLYFRLAAASLRIPPLRERKDDIEPLIRHFSREITGNPVSPLSDQVLESLQSRPWIGNVRELRNVVDNLLTVGEEISEGVSSFLDAEVPAPARTARVTPYRIARKVAVERFERQYLADLVKSTEGNASGAARLACMDRPYLLSLLRKHGLR